MDVFEYAASCEAMFEEQYAECGKARLTTFYSDLSIAEYCNINSITQTFNNVCENYIESKEYFTEFVICLNWKSWEWDGHVRKYKEGSKEYNDCLEVCEKYIELFEKARDLVYEKWADKEDWLNYFYQMTD